MKFYLLAPFSVLPLFFITTIKGVNFDWGITLKTDGSNINSVLSIHTPLKLPYSKNTCMIGMQLERNNEGRLALWPDFKPAAASSIDNDNLLSWLTNTVIKGFNLFSIEQKKEYLFKDSFEDLQKQLFLFSQIEQNGQQLLQLPNLSNDEYELINKKLLTNAERKQHFYQQLLSFNKKLR